MSGARLLALTHVGLLTDDVERTATRWQRLFGAARVGRRPTWHATEEGLLSTVLALPGGVIEPVQPTKDGVHRDEFAGGRRAYHAAIQVERIHDTVAALRAGGLWVQLRRPGEVLTMHRGWVDPASTCGLVIELSDVAEVVDFVSPEEAAALTGGDSGAELVRRWSAIGLAVRDIERASSVFRDVLGFRQEWDRPVEVAEEGCRMQRFRLGAGPAIEVAEPADGRSVVGEHLAAHGEGIAYLSMTVADVDRVTDELSGMQAWLRSAPAGPHLPRRTWVHARSTDGVHVLLMEG